MGSADYYRALSVYLMLLNGGTEDGKMLCVFYCNKNDK